MKNKKLKYILVPLLIIVWGAIFFKIYNYTADNDNYSVPFTKKNILASETNSVDSFSIYAEYRDPFLGSTNNYSGNRSNNANNVKKVKNQQANIIDVKQSPVQNAKWPQMKYGGIVINKKNEKATGILHAGNKDFLVQKGNTYENIEIKGVYKDSLVVKFGNVIRSIIKDK